MALDVSGGINFHGAFNLENFTAPVQAERTDATSTIAPFEKLEADNLGKKRICIFADKARRHHARPVRQWLERPGRRVKPIFRPAYAPHLNAIERLGSVMHREAAHNRFHANVPSSPRPSTISSNDRLSHEGRSWRNTSTDHSRIISHKNLRIPE